METKKSKKAQLECHRGTWLLMGVITVLGFMFVSFEWAQRDIELSSMSAANDPFFEATLVPITFPEVAPPPPPPPAPPAADQINVVENNSTVDETGVQNSEWTNDPVEIVYIPPVSNPEPVPVEPEIWDFAEVMPSFKGGTSALNSYLSKSIRYPTMAQEEGIEGKVIIQFVVDRDGSISNPVVVRSAHPQLDKEALRVIQNMPRWEPGRQGGKAVRVKFTVPVDFRLQR